MATNVTITNLILTVLFAIIFDLVQCQNTGPTTRCTCNTNAYSNSAQKTVNHGGSQGCDITLYCHTGYNLKGGPTKVYCDDGVWIDEHNVPIDLSTYSCDLNIINVVLAVVGIACVAIVVILFIYCAIKCSKRRRRKFHAPDSTPIRKFASPINNNISYEDKKLSKSMTNLSELDDPGNPYFKPIPSRRPIDLPKDRTTDRTYRTIERTDPTANNRLTSTPKKTVTTLPYPSRRTLTEEKAAMIDELENGGPVEVYTTPEYDQNVDLDSEEDDFENQDTIEELLDGSMNNTETKLTRL